MTDNELEKRLDGYRQSVEAAQLTLGVPAFAVYAAMTPVDGKEPPSVIGGELIYAPGRTADRGVELRFLESVTLLGYLWSRIEVLKQEASAMFGPQHTLAVQRELQGNMREGSATGLSGFQQSLVDLVESYRPAVAVGSTVGHAAPAGSTTPMESGAQATFKGTAAPDVVLALAAIKRQLRHVIAQAAKQLGIEPKKLQSMIDAAAAHEP